MEHLSPAAAGQIAKRGRALLRAGEITHRELALLDCLLWSCRTPGRALARVSYTKLEQLVRICRETVAKGLDRLEAVGLLRRQKVRLRVVWGGATASRQGVSVYQLLVPATESADQTVYKGPKDSLLFEVVAASSKPAREAQAALAEVARRRLCSIVQPRRKLT